MCRSKCSAWALCWSHCENGGVASSFDEAKTAVEVRKGANGFVSREEVARAVRELMAEPEGEAVKENVRILRDKVKETVCEDGSVQESVEQFLAELRTSHL
jgi:hypothetical protein